MRVLITGCTAMQINSPRGNALGVASIPKILNQALLDLGHTVEWRPVAPGETLNEFDRVFVFLTSPNKLGTTYAYGAWWALSRRADAVVSFDDWQLMQVAPNFKTSHKRHEYYFWENVVATCRKHHKELVADTPRGKRWRAAIDKLVTTYATKPWPHRVLLPLFAWGDPLRFNLPLKDGVDQISTWDPSPYYVTPGFKEYKQRERSWVLASLFSHTTWLKKQDLRWPIKHFGHKASGNPIITEAEVVQQYAKASGVLSPAYPHRGGGWWRVRVLHALDTRSLLYLDDAEAGQLVDKDGIRSSWFTGLHKAEIGSRLIRETYLDGQEEVLGNYIASKDTMLNSIKEVLRG